MGCSMSVLCWSGPGDERGRRRQQAAVPDAAHPDQKPRGLPEVRPQAVHDRLSGRGLSLGRGAVKDQRELAGLPGERRRSEEHTSELQSRLHLVCRLLLEKKKKKIPKYTSHQ